MVWALGMDDFKNRCNDGPYPLLHVIKDVLGGGCAKPTPPKTTENPSMPEPTTKQPVPRPTSQPPATNPTTQAPVATTEGNGVSIYTNDLLFVWKIDSCCEVTIPYSFFLFRNNLGLCTFLFR